MAIYSLNHKTVGLSTHEAGNSGAHIRYICRCSTVRAVLSNQMPETPMKIARWFDKREKELRKNARMLDKIMVALPIEFDEYEREALVERFVYEITSNEVPWIAAIHDKGKDARNPHAHIAIHDRDLETGKTKCQLSEQGSTQKIRVLWKEVLNDALEKAGLDQRVDERSLRAQGIDRKPQIHVGPKAKAMMEKGITPKSKNRIDKRGREIRYVDIDQGRTRDDYNKE